MTDSDLAKIEKSLKVRLPAEYHQILSSRATELGELVVHYPWSSSPYFAERLYLDADRIIDVNSIERQAESGTSGAFPEWHKQFILFGDDGGGGYYCLRIDGQPGVFMIGSDSGDQPELKSPSLKIYVEELLADYPAMARRYPAPGRSSFDGSCEPNQRVAIFLDSQEFEGNGRVVFQGGDGAVTVDTLYDAGVDCPGIEKHAAMVMAALMQCAPDTIAVQSFTQEGDPALRLNITGLPNQLNDRPYWYVALQVYGSNAEIVFYGLVPPVPPKIALDWRRVTSSLIGLIKAAYPGEVRITGTPAKAPVRRGDRLIYTLPFELQAS